MRILRHEIEITDYQEIRLPRGSELLSVAKSRVSPDRVIDLWSLDREDGAPLRPAGVYVIGTGNPMPNELFDPDKFTTWRKFLGTVVTPIGLVWHVFGGPLR